MTQIPRTKTDHLCHAIWQHRQRREKDHKVTPHSITLSHFPLLSSSPPSSLPHSFFLLSFCDLLLRFILSHRWIGRQQGSCGLHCCVWFVIAFSFCYLCIPRHLHFFFFIYAPKTPSSHRRSHSGLASQALRRW